MICRENGLRALQLSVKYVFVVGSLMHNAFEVSGEDTELRA